MLDIHKPPPSTDTKTHFTHSLLPSYIDPLHPPNKKSPFHTFTTHPTSHTLDLLLPPEIWNLVHTHLEQQQHPLPRVYTRLWLKLDDILTEEFLDTYIRTPSLTLISSGREGVDTRFEIISGVLKIEMPRSVYERAGLVGKSIEDGGRKHQNSRWVVEYDLTASSMQRGKKGFERLRWAAREVLRESRVWLCYCHRPGFEESAREGREVLSRHAPKVIALDPELEEVKGVRTPKLDVADNGLSALYDPEDARALLEWLDVLTLDSAAVREGSRLDSHLSRYEVPDFGHGAETRDLVRVRWRGLITTEFAREMFLAVWTVGYKSRREAKRRKGEQGERSKQSGQSGQDQQGGDVIMEDKPDEDKEAWFSMSAQAFGGRRGWSLMQFQNRETLVWEVEG